MMASMVANKFSIVTTLSRSVPALEKLVMHYGMSDRCISVRASDVPVLDLENGDADNAIAELDQQPRQWLRQARTQGVSWPFFRLRSNRELTDNYQSITTSEKRALNNSFYQLIGT